ncbi:MAG: glutaredoxin family protein [Anaerolineae bacterium]|nr:glutaredoxin family protein [Anaerolineae bacterium]
MAEPRGSVPGPHDKHRVLFYGLSTCIWCRKTRQFLEEQGVKFDFVYVDLIHGQEREDAKEQIRKWNPAVSFPTIVIDSDQSVTGFKPEKIKEALEL